MTFFALPAQPSEPGSPIKRLSIKEAGYKEDVIRDLVAGQLDKFFPGLKLIATEFSRWQDSGRRIDILAMGRDNKLHVFEFKRDSDAAHAELQALRYAAMCSVLTFKDIVHAGVDYRKKIKQDVSIESFEAELLQFLEAQDAESVVLGEIPRIVLISSQFNKEITTTALWLNEKFGPISADDDGMDISCIEVGVYEVGSQKLLHFDKVIPIPAAQDYQVQARAKERLAAQQQAAAKRARTVALLIKAGELKDGTRIEYLPGTFKSLAPQVAAEGTATHVGQGRFVWDADGQTYDSMNALMKALMKRYNLPEQAVQAPKHWRLAHKSESMAQTAEALIAVDPGDASSV